MIEGKITLKILKIFLCNKSVFKFSLTIWSFSLTFTQLTSMIKRITMHTFSNLKDQIIINLFFIKLDFQTSFVIF